MIFILPTLATLRIPFLNKLNDMLKGRLVVLIKEESTRDRERGELEKCNFKYHIFTKKILKREMQKEQIVVVTNTRDALQLMRFRFAGAKVIYWLGETETTYSFRTGTLLKKFIKYWTYKNIDMFACYSQETIDFLTRRYAINPRLLHHVPQSIDYSAFAKQSCLVDHNNVRFVVISRLDRTKNISRLIEEFAAAQKQYQNISLDIYGRGDQYSQLLHQSENLPFVNIRGFVPYKNVPNTLSKYNVFIMQTLQDSWGLTVNEAITAKLLVVISKYAPAKELIRHNASGYIFDPNNSESYTKAFNWVMDNLNISKKITNKNYNNVVTHYHSDLSAEAFFDIRRKLRQKK